MDFLRLYVGFLNCFVEFLDAQTSTGDEHFLTTTRKINVKVSGMCIFLSRY